MRHTRLAECGPLAARIVLVGCALAMPSDMHAQSPHSSVRADSVPFEVPAWAFPALASPAPATILDSVALLHVPRSGAAFTQAQTRDLFSVVDWHSDTHAAMPPIVARGRKPAVAACGYCHLPDGIGRPENAMLAGLPESYFIQQVADMKSRARRSASPVPWRPSEGMRAIADSATDAEIADAARYFSRLRGKIRSRVVESDSVPRTIPFVGLYVPAPGGGMEALGRRLIEMTPNLEGHELRDAANEYVAYVPRGSIDRGRSIARGGVGGTQGCMRCHGLRMRGGDAAPPLAGRSPSYILRQLVAFKVGTRASLAGAPMRAVAAALTLDDMIAAAAYAGSRPP